MEDGVAWLAMAEAQGEQLPPEVWRAILQRLPVAILARAACVCRLWHHIVSDPEVMASSFRSAWKVKEVKGRPATTSFWRRQHLGQFAISHQLRRHDSLQGLALRYHTQVPDILRLNNMMNEHAIHSRRRLLIPVTRAEILEGQTCFIELDICAKREVAVLYLEGSRAGHHTKASLFHSDFCRGSQSRVNSGIVECFKRSMRVDDEVARYYLLLADGDIRAAYARFNDDMRWESETSRRS